MIKSGTSKDFNNFTENKKVRWSYANSILYGMCRTRPKHDLKDVAASKLFLISRGFFDGDGYATVPENEELFYDVIAPIMQREASKIDHYISLLNEDCRTIPESRAYILEAHRYIMGIFSDIKNIDCRMLAARYLHFHCPGMVYLYSKAAHERVNEIVTDEKEKELPLICDEIYAVYFEKLLELQTYLYAETGIYRSPLELDRFLTGKNASQKGLPPFDRLPPGC